MVWPLTILALVFWFRGYVHKILGHIANRIERGDSFEAGPLKLGHASEALEQAAPEVKKALEDNKPKSVYLVHRSKRAADLDKDGKERYRIRIWLDADDPQLLDQVQKVTYYLHPSFKEPVRVIDDRQTLFGLNTVAWGEFNLKAVVTNKDNKTYPLERYINLA